jgi:nucleotide-binding universal stress UspA family protein
MKPRPEPPLLRQILAATDLSAVSRHAAERAASVAAASGAALRLQHVVSGSALDELRTWLGAGTAPEQAVLAAARQQLHALASQIGLAQGLDVQADLSTGVALDALLASADQHQADLLVLGARGASTLRRLALGSTAERLLRRSQRPLLVVRQKVHERYRRVLVPVDFSPWSGVTLALAQRVAPQAHLVLLHTYEAPFVDKLRFAGVDEATVEQYRRQAQAQASQQLHALAHEQGLAPGSWTPRLLPGEAWPRIIEQEQEQDCDLIALGKHGRHAAEELLLGSVTKTVLAEAQGDVLVATLPAGSGVNNSSQP